MTLAIHPDGSAVVCRRAVAADQAYCAKTWTLSLASAEVMSRTDASKLVDRILNDRASRCVVACEPDDADAIVGFLVHACMTRTRCIHHVNVRRPRRNQGIARAMMRFAGLDDNVTLPLVYTLDGPSAHSLLQKFHATKVSLEDVLS